MNLYVCTNPERLLCHLAKHRGFPEKGFSGYYFHSRLDEISLMSTQMVLACVSVQGVIFGRFIIGFKRWSFRLEE